MPGVIEESGEGRNQGKAKVVGGGLLNPNYLVNTCTQAYRIIIIITVITIIINCIRRA